MTKSLPQPSSELVLIPFGASFLALSREDFKKALDLGRDILGSTEVSPVTNPTDKLLDAEGASEMTGIPASWFLEAARRGRIPHIKAGKYVRFRLADVLQALEVRPERQPGHTASMNLVQKAGKPK